MLSFLKSTDAAHAGFWLLRHASTKFARVLPALPFRRRPQIVDLELTNDCDIDCSFCYRAIMTRSVGYMDPDLIRRIAGQVAAWPYRVIRLVGVGEPALHPEIATILAMFRDRRIPVEITTNGKLFDRIAPAELLDLGVHTVAVSVDGYDARSYNRVRRGGDYDRLFGQVSRFHAARQASGRRRPWLVIRNVIFPGAEFHHRDRIDAFKAAWAPVSDRIRFNTLEKFSGEQYDTGRVCDDIFYNMHIRWDGRVPLCGYGHLYAPQEWMGDASGEDLADIWRAARWNEVRGGHLRGDLATSDFCRKCFTQQCQKRIKTNQRDHNIQSSAVGNWIERQVWKIVR